METIFMNTESSKSNKAQKFVLYPDKTGLLRVGSFLKGGQFDPHNIPPPPFYISRRTTLISK